MHAASLLLFVFAAIRSVSALPFPALVATLPSDVTHIAHDEVNNAYIAFKRDGSVYGRYAIDSVGRYNTEKRQESGTCGEATLDQLKQLPDFNLIEKYADENFGTGKRNVLVNPSDFPDRPARSCVSSNPINFQFTGQPNCQELNASSEGQLVGTGGSVAIETQQGFNAKATYTTTRTSFFSVGLKVSAQVGVPAIAGATSEFTMNSEFTNENVKSNESQTNNIQKTTITMNAEPGKNKTKSCSVQGKGELPFIASGFVWFNYEDKQKGHFKWAASIEQVLNEGQRSSSMEITGNVNSESKSSFAGECAFPPGSEGEKKEKEAAQKAVEEEQKKKADEEAKKKAEEDQKKAEEEAQQSSEQEPVQDEDETQAESEVEEAEGTIDADEEVLDDTEAQPGSEVEDTEETIESDEEAETVAEQSTSFAKVASTSVKASTKPTKAVTTSTKATATAVKKVSSVKATQMAQDDSELTEEAEAQVDTSKKATSKTAATPKKTAVLSKGTQTAKDGTEATDEEANEVGTPKTVSPPTKIGITSTKGAKSIEDAAEEPEDATEEPEDTEGLEAEADVVEDGEEEEL